MCVHAHYVPHHCMHMQNTFAASLNKLAQPAAAMDLADAYAHHQLHNYYNATPYAYSGFKFDPTYGTRMSHMCEHTCTGYGATLTSAAAFGYPPPPLPYTTALAASVSDEHSIAGTAHTSVITGAMNGNVRNVPISVYV